MKIYIQTNKATANIFGLHTQPRKTTRFTNKLKQAWGGGGGRKKSPTFFSDHSHQFQINQNKNLVHGEPVFIWLAHMFLGVRKQLLVAIKAFFRSAPPPPFQFFSFIIDECVLSWFNVWRTNVFTIVSFLFTMQKLITLRQRKNSFSEHKVKLRSYKSAPKKLTLLPLFLQLTFYSKILAHSVRFLYDLTHKLSYCEYVQSS